MYVGNRQAEVREATDPAYWRKVPGEKNPADLLIRGVADPSELMQTNTNGVSWFMGPGFLKEEEEKWPATTIGPLDPNDPELRKKSVLVGLGFVEKNTIDPGRFSTWTKLVRVVS